jgi:hypothetical protein
VAVMRQASTAALLAASLLALSLLAAPAAARGASFVVEKGSMRIRHPAIAGSIDTAVGDVRARWHSHLLARGAALSSLERRRHPACACCRTSDSVILCHLCCLQFGVPLYGGTLSGAVVFDSSNAQGCREFAPPLAPLPSGLPIVLLVDRGGECCIVTGSLRACLSCVYSSCACKERSLRCTGRLAGSVDGPP